MRLQTPPKPYDDFLNSPAWRALVAEIIGERGRKCEHCAREGVRLFGDHITERQDGGALLDKRNVQLLCGSCHSTKTARARAERMRR
jgi:5-methylcytosine-specific restriction endonuclease McrA